jgi:phosphoglycolate phosphatase
VSREACADAFRQVTGQPLVALPQAAGRTDSEIFFEALALNDVPAGGADDQELLARYFAALAAAFSARRELLPQLGRVLPGAIAAVTAAGQLPGVVQSVLTGTIRPNATAKLQAFGLAGYLEEDIGGYGSAVYPKGAELLQARSRAGQKYGVSFGPGATVYLADSTRDVTAALTGGARMIAVASGRSTAAELREAGADVVLGDLSDTAAVTAAIEALTAPVTAG